MGIVEDFISYRSRMNEKIMASDSLIIKRIFNLDTNAYAEGHLDVERQVAHGDVDPVGGQDALARVLQEIHRPAY